jgi:hypothetical protein
MSRDPMCARCGRWPRLPGKCLYCAVCLAAMFPTDNGLSKEYAEDLRRIREAARRMVNGR